MSRRTSKAGSRQQGAAATLQASFDFDALLAAPADPATVPAAVVVSTQEPVAMPWTAPLAHTPTDFEALARTLEAHPDYRVLRRLQACTDWGPAPANMDAARVRRVLLVDTETTGLQHARDKIIELAMLSVQVDGTTGLPFGPVAVFEGFEDPGMPIPEAARLVTGITDDMVRGQRLDETAVQALVAQADCVIAHNAGFDRPFLEARMACFSDKPWACSWADIDWKALGATSSGLGALAQDRGWFFDAHRALMDCHALLRVLVTALDAQGNGLSRLLAAADSTSYRLRATGAPYESKDLLKERGYRWDAEGRVWVCTLPSAERLEAECAWLKSMVYAGRAARVVLEAQDGRSRYASRPGVLSERSL
ncbi:MAG: hypothetical protein RLZZ352_1453 [Pseudomonadota bacterium]|jgi:DNA polymerase-3 subunit epsilon